FQFFTDHEGELGRLVSEGRKREFAAAGWGHDGAAIPDPQARETFQRSKLQWEERDEPVHAATLALYVACLRERQTWLRGPALRRENWRVASSGEWVGIRYHFPEGER